jgi:hypothetical protein
MRPRLLSVRNFALLLVALGIFGGLAYWIHGGMALPGAAVPSTAGKLAFISDRNGHSDLFMMNGADGGSLTALTNDAPDDREPAWSMDGSLLGFVSQNRVGAGAQIFEMNAEPGARVVPLTHTSSAKEAPAFAVGGRVFYLGGGTLGSTTSDGTDTDLVFPSADELKALQGTEDQPGILSMGGVSRAIPSPDGVRIAATLKTDHGAALVLYNSETKLCTLIGIGERIFSGFAADGKLIAFFDNGSPLREPQPLFNADSIKAGMAARAKIGGDLRPQWDARRGPSAPVLARVRRLRTRRNPGRLRSCPQPEDNRRTAARRYLDRFARRRPCGLGIQWPGHGNIVFAGWKPHCIRFGQRHLRRKDGRQRAVIQPHAGEGAE